GSVRLSLTLNSGRRELTEVCSEANRQGIVSSIGTAQVHASVVVKTLSRFLSCLRIQTFPLRQIRTATEHAAAFAMLLELSFSYDPAPRFPRLNCRSRPEWR